MVSLILNSFMWEFQVPTAENSMMNVKIVEAAVGVATGNTAVAAAEARSATSATGTVQHTYFKEFDGIISW